MQKLETLLDFQMQGEIMQKMDLQGKVAIVTGAARGIGQAIALRFGQEGAKVVVVDIRDEQGLETVRMVEEAGSQAIFVHTDVTDASQVQKMVDATVERFGTIEILVNNAGVTRDTLIMRMSEEDWDIVLDTNLKSAYNCSKAVIRSMMKKRYGRIINMASVVGLAGQAGQANYAASKAGLIGFTKALAKEVGSRGITVNAVAPGFVTTAMTSVLPQEMIDKAIEATPLGRLGKPEDIADAVAFLASERASFITGQVLSVDGGLVMQ
jgi:3-oxoacyl-[acyl-carrier protein] reductase